MKNKILLKITVVVFLLINIQVFACDACKKQQPKITQNFTHGAGPDSNWDWVIIAIIALITLATFVYSIKYLAFPGEKNGNHIKQSIFNN